MGKKHSNLSKVKPTKLKKLHQTSPPSVVNRCACGEVIEHPTKASLFGHKCKEVKKETTLPGGLPPC